MATALTPAPSPPGEGSIADVRTQAAELLAFLRAAGFTVTAADGRVFVRPREKLSPAECGQVVALKAGLLELLAEERWVRCQLCLHYVDGGCPDDVQRLCSVKGCPYRGRKR